MNLLKKLRLFPLLVFVFSILFSASVTSCGKQAAGDGENTEHPAEGEDAEKAEHPEENAEEHPADSTKTEETQP